MENTESHLSYPAGRVVGRYEILGSAGRGALGLIYKARELSTHNFVALNQISPELCAVATAFSQLRAEIQKCLALKDCSIAEIYEFLETDTTPFLVSEWMDGENLGFRLLRNGPMALTLAAELLRPILNLFTRAHDLGLIHGSLQPRNIMVTPTGLKLTNFGFKARIESVYGLLPQIPPDHLIFIPPERIAGKRMDKRSDVYLLGAVLFQMLTGKQTLPLIQSGSRNIATLLPQFRQWLTPAIIDVLRQAMAEEPEDRFHSVEEFESQFFGAMREAIDYSRGTTGINDLTPIAGKESFKAEVPARKGRRWQTRAALSIGAALLGVISIAGLGAHYRLTLEKAGTRRAVASSGASSANRGIIPVRQQWTGFRKQLRIALVIGIDTYPPESGFRKLQYAVKDAQDFAGELKHQGYTVNLLTDSAALRNSIRKALRDAIAASDARESTLIFFFAGHGAEQDGKQFLATYESASDSLAELGLPLTELENLLSAGSTPRKIMFIDACRYDPDAGGKRGGPVNRFSFLANARGLRILNSTAPGQVSYEEPELGHGVFTHFLVDGLRGNAADSDGLVTFNSLASYVRDKMSAYTLSRNRYQVPFSSGEATGDGDILLGGSRESSAITQGAN